MQDIIKAEVICLCLFTKKKEKVMDIYLGCFT